MTPLSYHSSNLSLIALEAMRLLVLKHDNSILIKEANKGSAVVIWDREDYNKETKNLDNKNLYKELTERFSCYS